MSRNALVQARRDPAVRAVWMLFPGIVKSDFSRLDIKKKLKNRKIFEVLYRQYHYFLYAKQTDFVKIQRSRTGLNNWLVMHTNWPNLIYTQINYDLSNSPSDMKLCSNPDWTHIHLRSDTTIHIKPNINAGPDMDTAWFDLTRHLKRHNWNLTCLAQFMHLLKG